MKKLLTATLLLLSIAAHAQKIEMTKEDRDGMDSFFIVYDSENDQTYFAYLDREFTSLINYEFFTIGCDFTQKFEEALNSNKKHFTIQVNPEVEISIYKTRYFFTFDLHCKVTKKGQTQGAFLMNKNEFRRIFG
jgi:hypothetical protein